MYGYTFSDPINLIDPSGNFAIALPLWTLPALGPVGWGIGIGIGIGVGAIGWAGWEWYQVYHNAPKPPLNGPPNGSISIPDNNGGKQQERCYDDKGNPMKDIDWGHDHGAGRPHVHDWTPGPDNSWQRGPGRPPNPGEIK